MEEEVKYKVGDYAVYKDNVKFKGILLVLVDIDLKKVYAIELKLHGYLLSFDDVRPATIAEVNIGHRL